VQLGNGERLAGVDGNHAHDVLFQSVDQRAELCVLLRDGAKGQVAPVFADDKEQRCFAWIEQVVVEVVGTRRNRKLCAVLDETDGLVVVKTTLQFSGYHMRSLREAPLEEGVR